MNTRNARQMRMNRQRGNPTAVRRAPIGLGAQVKPRLDLADPTPAYTAHPACSTLPEHGCLHPLTDLDANGQLEYCEDSVKQRFDRIVPFLQNVAGLPLGP